MRNTSPQLPQVSRTSTPQNTANFDLTRLLYGTTQNSFDDKSPTQPGTISLSQLRSLQSDWIMAGARAAHSPRTLGEKKILSNRFLEFAVTQKWTIIGKPQLEAYFDHLAYGHLEPKGRFGIGDRDARAYKPLKPGTQKTHFTYLSSWFSWLEKQGHLVPNPFGQMEKVRDQPDQITPFTSDQVRALLHAAKHSACPHRNTALILFMLDTGVRASELCGIRLADVDFSDQTVLRVRVFGKGQKHRTLRLSPETTEALWKYFKNEHGLERFYKRRTNRNRADVDPSTPLFISAHRAHLGQPLTRDGLRLLIVDLGKTAHIGAVRCSPHTFRHTFAISFLRNGGHMLALKEMLGHTSVMIVQRYVNLAQADVEAQHTRFSPASSLLRER